MAGRLNETAIAKAIPDVPGARDRWDLTDARPGFRLHAWVGAMLLIVLAAAGPAEAAISIAPSALRVNLGPIPIDRYSTTVANGTTIPSCSATISVRACMQSILKNYAGQDITGVRFQLGLGGGSTMSTAFDATGKIQSAWVTNLSAFFYDLRSAGMLNIAPTPALGENWSGTLKAETVPYLAGAGCPTGSEQLLFLPWLPYGFDATTQLPADRYINNAYNCSPKNPIFWGWMPYFQLVYVIASEAKATGLTIEELDIQNEIQLYAYTVQARLVYDDTTTPPTPVRTMVGNVLASVGFDAGTATYSVAAGNPQTTRGTCNSVYGDAASLITASELLAALSGGPIGAPPHVAPNGTMPCDASTAACGSTVVASTNYNPNWKSCAMAGMIAIPAQSEPTVVDNHVYPCATDPSSFGQCILTAPTYGIAQDTYSALWTFIQANHVQFNKVIIGETDSASLDVGCDDHWPTMALENSYGYFISTLFANNAPKTVLRPWGYILSPACPPLLLGAPNGPYNPS